jgi:outer membrane protein OmpA-like peptidoglycan-associated protein
MRHLAALLALGLGVVLPGTATAAPESEAKAGGSVRVGGDSAAASGDATASGPSGPKETRKEKIIRAKAQEKEKPWLRRWEPQRNLGELGIAGGVLFPSADHDLYDPRTRPQKALWNAGPDISFRAAFFPLRPLGVEAEFSGNPTRARTTTNDPVFVYGFRGHVILQVPVTRINPFLLGGYGLMGIRSNILVLGNDIDPAFHYGGGVKIAVTRMMSARVEARQIVSATAALQDSGTYHVQLLAGLSLVLGRKVDVAPLAPPPENPDRDGDGIFNEVDECPDTPGTKPSGCPDTDGDGFVDSVDACVEIPGVEPRGCPSRDTDGDKIADRDDECVFLPENYNDHLDEDGCPERLPPKLVQFDGVISGIVFDFGKDTIRPESKPKLDSAVAVLQEFPGVSIKIVGHTDNVGTEEANLDLSQRRAKSVKKYLTDAGVDASRIETDGLGPNAPIADNTSEEGRALNRRIEFEITQNVAKEVAQ